MSRRTAMTWMLLAVAAAAGPLAADEQPSARPAYREIRVPAAELDRWLHRGDWRAIGREAFDNLIADAAPTERQPPGAWIARAVYSASLSGELLASGRLTWDVRRSSTGRGGLLHLDPIGLALEDLEWTGDGLLGSWWREPAAWGAAQDGSLYLHLDRPLGQVSGRWNLRGRRSGPNVEFEVELAPAAVSELRLNLPPETGVSASPGAVVPPGAGDAGVWRVLLGSEGRTRLTIGAVAEMAAAGPLVLAETDMLCLARRDGLRVQAAIRLDVLRSAVRTVNVMLPADVHVFSVRYARETVLSWNTTPQGQWQRLTIDLPDRLSGSSRSISIDGTAPAVFEAPAALPTALVENAVFQSGRIRLVLERPLELKDYELDGCREREGLAVNGNGETITFEQLRPQGRINVTIGEAAVHPAARTIQLVEMEPETWRLRAELEWWTRSGRSFTVEARLPRGWDLVHVRPADSTSGLAHQEMLTDDDGSRRLLLEFHQAVGPDAPRRIQILAERAPPVGTRPASLPLIRPHNVAELENVVIVDPTAASRPFAVRSATLQPLATDAVPEFALGSELWQSASSAGRPAGGASGRLVFTSRALDPRGRIHFAGAGEAVEAPRPTAAPAQSAVAPPSVAASPEDSAGPISALRPAALLELRSTLSAGDGFDRHLARYVVQPQPAPAQLTFRMPAGCELLGVKVARTRVVVSQGADGFGLPEFPADRTSEFEIHYRAPAARGFLRRSHAVPTPVVPLTVVHFDWKFLVPPGWEVRDGFGDVVLQQDPASVPWTRRLFGALGRPVEVPAFNPLDPADWRRAVIGDPAADENAMSAGGERRLHAGGWRAWSATGLDAPAALNVPLWSPAHARGLGWVVLLGSLMAGVVARMQAYGGRARVGFVAATGSLLLALVLPPDLALVCGGVLPGILLASVLPRAWLGRTLPAPRVSAASADSTHSGPRVLAGTAGGLVLAAVSILSWQVLAQPPATPLTSASAPAQAFDSAVLIPVEGDGAPVHGLYASRELLEKLEAAAAREPRPPDYLIESAEYGGDVDSPGSVRIEAAFRVAALTPDRPLRVELPIRGAFPSDEPGCLVNGKPGTLLVADDGRTLVVEWDRPPDRNNSAQFLEIVVPLQVTLAEPPGYGDLSLAVPWSGRAAVDLRFHDPQHSVEFVDAAGPVDVAADGGRVQADLGRTNRIVAAWTREESPAGHVAATDVQTRVYTLVNVQPSRLEYQCRIVSRLERGAVDRLEWMIPSGAVVRQVTADGLADYSVMPVSPDESRLSADFVRPREGEFHVDVALMLPVTQPSESIRVLPVIMTEAGANEGPARVQTRELGVTTGSEFLIRTTAPAGAAQVPTAAFLQAFARTGEPPAGLREPLEAWRLANDIELSVALQLRQASRRVRLRQSGAVLEGELRWAMQAEVEIRDAAAWRHSLIVNPRMIIDSISVRHDEAERLVRWSRSGDRLELFLRDESVGVQDIALSGRVPIESSGQIPLPLVEFEQATVLESRVELESAPNVDVDLERVEGVEAEPVNGDPSSDAGKLRVVGRFRLTPPLPIPPRLRWRPRAAPPAVEPDETVEELAEPVRESQGTRRWDSPQPKLHTAVHAAAGGRRLGRTTLLVESDGLREVVFSWPAGLRMRAALADGLPAVARLVHVDSADRMVVEREDGESLNVVTLFWERNRRAPLGAVGSLVQAVPAALEPLARASIVTVTAPEPFQVFAGGIDDSARSADLSDDHIQGLLASSDGMGEDARLLAFHAVGATPPDDQTLAAGIVPAVDGSMGVRLWMFDRRWLWWALAALGAVVCFWWSSRIVRLDPGERLARHPLAAVLLVGIIWWLCLVPGVLGFLLAVATVLFGASRLFRRIPEPASSRPSR